MKTSEREFVITKVLNAPRELVWKMYTEEKHLQHWWGPKGLKLKVEKLDVRPGGIFHYSMETPDGIKMYGKFVYKEIKAPELLEFIVSFSDGNAGIVRHPLSDTWPLEMYNRITFTEENGKTTMRLSVYPVNATEEESNTFHSSYPSMEEGFGGTFDQLIEYLKSIQA